jgi:hypothetical protein
MQLRWANIVFMLLVMALLAFGQGKDTLFTSLSTDGKSVWLNWSKNHPWAEQLGQMRAELVAEYRTERRGLVSETLTLGSAGERSQSFSLPQKLTGEPLSNVCFYVFLPQKRVALPIRRATSDNGDTSRFALDEWTSIIGRRAAIRRLENEIQTMEQEVAALSASEQTLTETLAKKGQPNLAACDALQAPSSPTDGIRPYSAVEPDQQDTIAKRICVQRAWKSSQRVANILDQLKRDPELLAGLRKQASKTQNIRLLAELFTFVYMLPALSSQLSKEDGNPYQAKAKLFLHDWEALSNGLDKYAPHLGHQGELLKWPSSSVQEGSLWLWGPAVAKSLNAEWLAAGFPATDEATARSVTSAVFDAYFDCVSDNKRQLRIAYDSWKQSIETLPLRRKAQRELLVSSCKKEWAKVDELTAKKMQLAEKLQLDRKQLAQIQAEDSADRTHSAASRVAVSGKSCRVD